MDKRDSKTSGLLLGSVCLLVGIVLLGSRPIECQEQITVESRDLKQSPNSENELADTLKYLEKLEKLDQYWSEVARPRFGRSEYKQQPLLGFRMQQPNQDRDFRSIQANSKLWAPRTRPMSGHNNPLNDMLSARLRLIQQRYNSNDAY